MQLRPYQQECIDVINAQTGGAHLVQLPTGAGKTVVFSHIPRRGRVLLLSHREELVRQPVKYYDCPVGIEQAEQHAADEPVVSASVQTLSRRLERFDPDSFDLIITDECHHASSATYRKIYDYFHPRLHLGFTATPNRADGVGLNVVYEDIIFSRDLRWMIEQGYLCNINCIRAHIGYDLRNVSTRGGDYAPGELQKAMDGTAKAIAQAYREHGKGATLIFAAGVEHAQQIAKEIPGSVVVTGDTKDRASIIAAFTKREIPVLINCMVFTEGTDIPLVETVIIARPTQSQGLYCQMVGRGLRLAPGKDRLTLIDCVGATRKNRLCTAPSLLGISMEDVPESHRDEVQGDLLDLPSLAMSAADNPDSWIRSIELIDLWAEGMAYNLHGVNWVRLPDGSMVVQLANRRQMRMPPPDKLGRVEIGGEMLPYQAALDRAFDALCKRHEDEKALWDTTIVKRWGRAPATEKQIAMIRRSKACKGWTIPQGLTKGQASCVINHIKGAVK